MRRNSGLGTRISLLSFLLALSVAGCERAPETPIDASGDLVLATFDGGTVTLADLDALLVDTAAEQQWDEAASSPERLLALVERIAVERLVLQGPLAEAVPKAAVDARLRDIERRAGTRVALAREPLTPPTQQDLENHLEAHRDRFARPERRRVFHIFKRQKPDAGSDASPIAASDADSRAAIRAALEDLRARAESGENFGRLARAHSDSETRHRDGLLGTVERGRFSGDFDDVVFGLDEGAISPPVFTADGGHLFFVADVLPAREATVEALGVLLYRDWLADRQRTRIEDRARSLLDDRGETLRSADDFRVLLARRPPPAVLFQVGDVSFRRGALQRLLADAGAPTEEDGNRAEQALALLQVAYHQEIILQYGVDADSMPQEELAREREQVIAELAIARELRTMLAEDEARIARHHDRNRGRFSKPIRVSLSRARFPEADAALAATLESAVPELDSGRLTLEDLAADHGGRVDRLDERTAARLRAEDPPAVRFAFALTPKQHSPPYAMAGALHLLRLDQRHETEEAPLDAVRGAVIEDLYRQQSGVLYETWSRAFLAEHNFRADRERLAGGARLLARLPTD